VSEIVEKWVAGFWCDRLYVVKGHFKKTAKQYRREGGSHADDMDLALKWSSRFDHDTDLLHDTAEEALDALSDRLATDLQTSQAKSKKIQGNLDLIDDFEIST
jgi:hypothetical protein